MPAAINQVLAAAATLAAPAPSASPPATSLAVAPSPPPAAIEEAPAAPPLEATAEPASAVVADAGRADEERLELIRSALEANRIDLYLQPIVSLPQRKVRYYEALSRLRSETGEVLNAADFVPLAQRAGLMARIDNLVIFRCVQVVRRLLVKNREVGLFCNLSESALTDAAGFQELLEYLDANQTIASSIVLEFTQNALRSAGPMEHESLSALADRGFRFSLDNLDDLRIEPRELAARGFRYVKIPGRFLIDPKDTPADIHPADLSDLLGRFGIELVAEKIETEAVVVDLLDCDVRFGQGNLFSPPRPVRAEALQGIAERGEAPMRNDGRPAHLAGNGLRTGLAQLARGTVTRN
jgi:cyclic-di-GMP phosphodiesterase TipF (flagellum assembly factor)